MGFRTPARLPLLLQVAIDRFQRNNSDPSVIVFSVIKRCQLPHSTQFFQKAKNEPSEVALGEEEVLRRELRRRVVRHFHAPALPRLRG